MTFSLSIQVTRHLPPQSEVKLGLSPTKSVKEAGIGNIVDENIEDIKGGDKDINEDSNSGNDAFQTIALKSEKEIINQFTFFIFMCSMILRPRRKNWNP